MNKFCKKQLIRTVELSRELLNKEVSYEDFGYAIRCGQLQAMLGILADDVESYIINWEEENKNV